MEVMESFVQITYSDGHGSAVSETGPLQRAIIEVFKLSQKT
jgi:hypothetical protein